MASERAVRGRVQAAAAAGVVLVVALALLWPALAGGRVLVAADFFGSWWGWSGTAPAGQAVHNPELSDNVLYYYPSWMQVRRSLASGEWPPLWNPWILGGTPFLANGESGLFSPLNALLYVLPVDRAFGATVLLQLVLAGTFMYLLLRELPLPFAPALLGAVAFALNGFFLAWLAMLNLVAAGLWLPLALLLLQRWRRLRRWRDLAGFTLVLTAQLLAGFLQVSLYVLLACGLYWLVPGEREAHPGQRRLGGALLAVLAAFLLAAVQLLPHLELIGLSQREPRPPEWTLLNTAHLRHLATLVAPDFEGSPLRGDYRGPLNYTETCGYVGLVPLVLAWVGTLASLRRQNPGLLFVVVASAGLLLYLETPLHAAFVLLVPGYGLRLGSTRAIFLFCFAAAALAAIGLDRVLRALPRPAWRTAAASAAIVLGALDLLGFGRALLTTAEPGAVYPEPGAVRFLRQQPGLWRVLGGEAFPPNSLSVYGLQDVQGYESLFPRRYKELLTVADASVAGDPDYHGVRLSGLRSPLLELLNVRYVVSPRPLAASGLALRYDGPVRVYEQERALPRAFVVHRSEVIPDRQARLRRLGEASFDPRRSAILEQGPELSLAGPDPSASSAEVVRYSPEQVVVRARSRLRGLLVLADSYYPGWVASLDGTPARILVANHALRAVELPPGDHEVEFAFRPGSFRLGLAVSAIALAALAAAVTLRLRAPDGPGDRFPVGRA